MAILDVTVLPEFISDKAAVVGVAGDFVLLYDADADALVKMDIAAFLGGGDDYITFEFSNINNSAIADNTTYFFGEQSVLGLNANQAVQTMFPSGTIEEAFITTYNASTVGSSELCTLRLLSNGGLSDDTISSAITLDAFRSKGFLITGLSIPITSGLSWMELDVPALATNPNAAQIRARLKFKPS